MEFDKTKYSTDIGNLKELAMRIKSIICDIYEAVVPPEIKTRKGIERMVMSDVEIIVIAILGELMTIDSERAWYSFCCKNLRDIFPAFCERSRYNRVRRNLHAVIRRCYEEITTLVSHSEEKIVDSMPIPVCKFGRAHFHKTFRGYGASYGRCASKKETYLGYKLHLLCDPNGYPADYLLTSANVDDRPPVPELVKGHCILALYADKGYTGQEFGDRMLSLAGIKMLPLPKSNVPQPPEEKLLRQHIFKVRRRIETTNSQLSDHLSIQRVRAKSLWGLTTRLASKFLAFAVAFLINICIGKPNPICIKSIVF
jgi:transposase